jgi:hypothetical protein
MKKLKNSDKGDEEIKKIEQYSIRLREALVLFDRPCFIQYSHITNAYGIRQYSYSLPTENINDNDKQITVIPSPINKIEELLYPYIISEIGNKLPIKLLTIPEDYSDYLLYRSPFDTPSICIEQIDGRGGIRKCYLIIYYHETFYYL